MLENTNELFTEPYINPSLKVTSPHKAILKMLQLLIATLFVLSNARPLETSPSSPWAGKRADTSAIKLKEVQGPQQAVTISSLAIFAVLYRGLMQKGFKLRLNGIHFCKHKGWMPLLSTDVFVGAGIGVVSMVWTGVVVAYGFLGSSNQCTPLSIACLGEMVYVPWILLFLFFFWVGAYLVQSIALECLPLVRNWDGAARAARWLNVWGARSKCTSRHSDWEGSIGVCWLRGFYAALAVPIGVTSFAAFQTEQWSMGLLLVGGWFLFVCQVGGENKLDRAPHRYAGDYLRVVMPSRHSYGLTYVLPSGHKRFHAVFSQRVENEYQAADQVEVHLKDSLKKAADNPIPDLQPPLSAFSAASCLHKHQLADLAGWVYQFARVGKGIKPNHECRYQGFDDRPTVRRAQGTQLIGKNLMYALCHAEYLVYQRRLELKKYQFDKNFTWRDTRTGSTSKTLDDLIPKLRWKWERSYIEAVREGKSFAPMNQQGLQGLEAAVRHVYRLFDLEPNLDEFWVKIFAHSPLVADHIFGCKCSHGSEYTECTNHASCAKHGYYAAHAKYLSKTWNECIKKSGTLFEALYQLTCHWRDDHGNIQRDEWIWAKRDNTPQEDDRKGRVHWCNSPIVASSFEDSLIVGDLVGFLITWRQAWYSATVAQLITMAPVIFGALLSAVLATS